MKKSTQFSPEVRERAVRMDIEHRAHNIHPSGPSSVPLPAKLAAHPKRSAHGVVDKVAIPFKPVNQHRLLGSVGRIPPAEAEGNYYRNQSGQAMLV